MFRVPGSVFRVPCKCTTMEKWDSFYRQYNGYPAAGTYAGASHIRYTHSMNQGGNEASSSAGTRDLGSVFTSATAHGAKSWTSFIPERQDSEPEPSSPGSPLSHEDPQVQVKPWCALNGTMLAACLFCRVPSLWRVKLMEMIYMR